MLRFAFFFTASVLLAADPQQEQARTLYQHGEYVGAQQLLLHLPSKDASAHDLIGRSHYMLGDYRKAVCSFQEALAAQPGDSDLYLWLGRAYGRRAEHSSPFTAPGYATKARQNFEKALELNPRNLEAMSDLFEYYLEAPGFLGGGIDKAVLLATKITQLDRAEGHYAQFKLAEKKGDLGRSEQELRAAAEAASNQPGRLVDLARFLAKQGRYQESEKLFHAAEKMSVGHPRVMFARADTYIQGRRNLGMARELLKRYLSAELTPDDPPRHEAEKLLKQVSGA